jgi:tartrate dehydrogenase/decarboxylase/D-malate dehydrogenase
VIPRSHRIAVIPGDGIGPEVVAQGIRVADAAARRLGFGLAWHSFPWGSGYYVEHGRMMPVDALDTLRGFDAILLGAVGDPRIQDHVTLNGLLLPIRRGFDQYACVRPARTYEGVRSPLAAAPRIDLVVVRENTEGEYAQAGGRVHQGTDSEVAIQAALFTRKGTERILRFAFELARTRRRRLASITKSNAQGHSMAFWDEVFAAVRPDYADVETESLLVDAACVHLVRRPESFDVLVGSNLFGDILSDLSPALAGSLGLAPSANLNPERRYPSMFEPVHGSAPDIAGRGIANPAAAILSAAMMLDFLGESEAGDAVDRAVTGVLAEGKTLTRDLGGGAATAEMGAAIADRVGT